MKNETVVLIIDRVSEINETIKKLHYDLLSWRQIPWTDKEKTDMSYQIERGHEQITKWLMALSEEFEE